jgi:hypothetical protein
MDHFDIDYAIIRATKQHGRGTGVKVARLELSDDGTPTGKVTLRNGRGENRGSFSVTEDGVKIHKAPVKREKKAAEAASTTE